LYLQCASGREFSASVRYQDIAKNIALGFEGGVGEAQPVPSEHERRAICGASRTTTRAAPRQLEAQGLITRRQGQGTFFQPRRNDKALGSMVDVHAEATPAGRVPRTRVIAMDVRAAEPRDIARFGAGIAETGGLDLVRLRSLDGDPAVLQRSQVDASMMAGIGAADLEDASLCRVIEARHGVTVASVEETLDPVKAAAAVFRSHRLAREAAGRVVEVSRNPIRGDRCRFTIRRQSPGTLP